MDNFHRVMTFADKRKLLSKDRFPVDGTLIQMWASQKNITPKLRKDGIDGLMPMARLDFTGNNRLTLTASQSACV